MTQIERSALRHIVDFVLCQEREDFLNWCFDNEVDEDKMTEQDLLDCPHIYSSALLADKFLEKGASQ